MVSVFGDYPNGAVLTHLAKVRVRNSDGVAVWIGLGGAKRLPAITSSRDNVLREQPAFAGSGRAQRYALRCEVLYQG